jgi:hypothetical protein
MRREQKIEKKVYYRGQRLSGRFSLEDLYRQLGKNDKKSKKNLKKNKK